MLSPYGYTTYEGYAYPRLYPPRRESRKSLVLVQSFIRAVRPTARGCRGSRALLCEVIGSGSHSCAGHTIGVGGGVSMHDASFLVWGSLNVGSFAVEKLLR